MEARNLWKTDLSATPQESGSTETL